MISYEPLWKTMKAKGVTTYTLIYKMGFSAYTITNLKRNKSITMNTMEKLCKVLQCTPNDIVTFTEDKETARCFCAGPQLFAIDQIVNIFPNDLRLKTDCVMIRDNVLSPGR